MDEIPLMALALRVVYVLFDLRSLGIRVESILNQDRYVFVTYRIDGRRIHHFCTEITKFGSLYISQLADSIGRTDHTRVGCHEAVYIRPNLQTIGIESCGNNSCGIVGTRPCPDSLRLPKPYPKR